jgi:hypothetical protein
LRSRGAPWSAAPLRLPSPLKCPGEFAVLLSAHTAEFTASTIIEDQVEVLTTYFRVVDKSLKGRFRTGTVEAVLEDHRGADGAVAKAEW